MRKFLSKLKNSVQKRTKLATGSVVGVLLTCVLISAGVPPHLAVPAGDIGGEIYETMKGGARDGEETESK